MAKTSGPHHGDEHHESDRVIDLTEEIIDLTDGAERRLELAAADEVRAALLGLEPRLLKPRDHEASPVPTGRSLGKPDGTRLQQLRKRR